MKQELIQYVNLLFAGNAGVEEIKQEILQNTLDRYDDLIAQGKTPEAAYRLAISGIGDVSELLRQESTASEPVFAQTYPSYAAADSGYSDSSPDLIRKMRAAAIGLYIISPIPLIALDSLGLDILGLCLTLMLVAAATVILLTYRKRTPNDSADAERSAAADDPKSELKRSVGKFISAVGLVLYLAISFRTHAWFITWLIFPIIGAIKGLVNACIDLKEVL